VGARGEVDGTPAGGHRRQLSSRGRSPHAVPPRGGSGAKHGMAPGPPLGTRGGDLPGRTARGRSVETRVEPTGRPRKGNPRRARGRALRPRGDPAARGQVAPRTPGRLASLVRAAGTSRGANSLAAPRRVGYQVALPVPLPAPAGKVPTPPSHPPAPASRCRAPPRHRWSRAFLRATAALPLPKEPGTIPTPPIPAHPNHRGLESP
jgi:hypothetical protein